MARPSLSAQRRRPLPRGFTQRPDSLSEPDRSTEVRHCGCELPLGRQCHAAVGESRGQVVAQLRRPLSGRLEERPDPLDGRDRSREVRHHARQLTLGRESVASVHQGRGQERLPPGPGLDQPADVLSPHGPPSRRRPGATGALRVGRGVCSAATPRGPTWTWTWTWTWTTQSCRVARAHRANPRRPGPLRALPDAARSGRARGIGPGPGRGPRPRPRPGASRPPGPAPWPACLRRPGRVPGGKTLSQSPRLTGSGGAIRMRTARETGHMEGAL